MSRINQILLGALGVQIVLAVLLLTGRDAPTVSKPTALIDGLDAAAINELVLTKVEEAKEGESAGKPQSVTLKRKDAGAWVLASHHDYAVDSKKVDELLGKLSSLRSTGAISENPAQHRKLEVSEQKYQRKIEISAGERFVLYVGSSPGFRKVHVRRDGNDAVHAVAGLSAWDANTSTRHWMQPHLKLDAANVTALRVKNEKGEVALQLGDDGNWKMATAAAQPAAEGEAAEPAALKQDEVKRIIDDAIDFTAEAPVGTGDGKLQGLAPAKTTVWIDVEKPAADDAKGEDAAAAQPKRETVQILIGNEDKDDSRYYVKTSNQPHIVSVATWRLRKLVELSAETLTEGGAEN